STSSTPTPPPPKAPSIPISRSSPFKSSPPRSSSSSWPSPPPPAPSRTPRSPTGGPDPMPLTRLRNRKADAYSVIPGVPRVPRYYAFLTTDHIVATFYANDGTSLADRGAIPLPAEPPSAENGILIAADPNAAVAPGALAWRSGDNELTVWDVANAAVYTSQGTIAAWCSPPVYHEGRLFWVEFPDQEDEPDTNQATLTLRHAACDLSDPQTLASVVFSAEVQSWDLGPRAKVAASASALLFESLWRDNKI